MERDRLSLQIAVIGLGRFGLAAARTLYQWGHEVLGIDCAAEAVQRAKDVVTHVVQADLVDTDLVRELGLHEVDAAIVAIEGNVEASIVSTTLLVDAGVPRVVARAHTPLHGTILERVGAHEVIYPEVASGEAVARRLRAPGIAEYLELGPDIGIGKLRAPESWVGRTLDELRLSLADPAFVALAIQRGDETLIEPAPDERVRAGDTLAVLVRESKLDELLLPLRRRR
jgi:trk system potassium uptake protein